MKQKLIVEIDLEKITKDILEKETYCEGSTVYNSIQEVAKREIKDWVKNAIVEDVKKSLNLDELRTNNYGKTWLKDEAKNIITNELREAVKELSLPEKKEIEKLTNDDFVGSDDHEAINFLWEWNIEMQKKINEIINHLSSKEK